MRIRHVVFGLGVGGTERAAQNLAIATARLGHETEVIAVSGGPRIGELESQGVDVRLVEAGSSTWDLCRSPTDVLVLHSHGLRSDFAKQIIEASPGASVGEVNVFSSPSPWMDSVDVSFQLSPWAHYLYVKRGGDTNRASTLPYPVAGKEFFRDAASGQAFRREHGISDDALVVGRVGQPYEGKWSRWLVQATIRLMSDRVPIHLLLIGAPTSLVGAARSVLGPGSVTSITRIEGDTALRSAYNAMDVFAHSAKQGESFGYVLAEASLCEIPIVTMATPWVDNSQGWVSGPSARVAITPRGFTQALRQVLTNPSSDSRAEDGRAGRRHVKESFDSGAIAAQMLEVLAGRRPSTILPSRLDLNGDQYFGFERFSAIHRAVPDPGSRLFAPLSGQESWRWFLTQELNDRGISRRGFSRSSNRL